MSNKNYPKVVAHRGGRKWAPENTMAAFKKSLALKGIDGIELDVHRCSSGELVVIHDDLLQRTTNGVGLVKDCSYSELQKLNCGEWFDASFASERLPLLSDVLNLVDGQLVINIEVKNAPSGYPEVEHDLLAALKDYKHKDKIIVSSFDHYFLKDLRAADPTIQIGVLGAACIVDIKQYADKFGATCVANAFDCTLPAFVTDVQKAGMQIMLWTLNSALEWNMAIQWGVDAICTDDPEGLIKHLDSLKAATASVS